MDLVDSFPGLEFVLLLAPPVPSQLQQGNDAQHLHWYLFNYPTKNTKNNQILSSNMILYMDDICLIFMNFFTSTSTWGRNIPPHATNHFKIASWSQGSCQEPHGGGVANPCGRRFLVFEGFLEQDDGRNWYKIFPMMGTGIKVSHFLEFHAFNVFLVVFFSFK